MSIALLQLNYTVGDLNGNVSQLLEAAQRAQAAGATFAVASELAVPGYPPRDLLDRPSFVRDVLAATERVTQAQLGMPLVFGSLGYRDGRLTNDALVVQGGKCLARASKQLLPTYDVFDERRHFLPGMETCFASIAGKRVALSICEDAWAKSGSNEARYTSDPLADVSAKNADLIVNLSASPFTLTKLSERPNTFAQAARRTGVPVLMVNQVGANDELVFDGQSSVWNAQGELLARAASFAEDVLLFEPSLLQQPGAAKVLREAPDCAEAALYQALVLGIRDYARKCGFKSAVLGLSGGIDSALVATLAADSLGPENVLGVAMPSRYSSDHSLTDARKLAENLKLRFEEVSIEPMFGAAMSSLSPLIERLKPAFVGDVTWENVQARSRGAIIMAISNRTGALALTTGNKSELAVGYCTLYGDMVGGLSVISDVPKTSVYRLSRWLNRNEERIPVSSIHKAPSAELRPDQTDQDSLPPYETLDRIIELYVEEQCSAEEVIRAGFDTDTVIRVTALIQRAEYKRRQAAPGLIVTRKAFGPGRRIPLAQRYREGLEHISASSR
jgi:NAD+ synthetase